MELQSFITFFGAAITGAALYIVTSLLNNRVHMKRDILNYEIGKKMELLKIEFEQNNSYKEYLRQAVKDIYELPSVENKHRDPRLLKKQLLQDPGKTVRLIQYRFSYRQSPGLIEALQIEICIFLLCFWKAVNTCL